MNILIVGKGGREHALAYAASRSKLVSRVYIAPGNVGMKNVGTLVDIGEGDISGLAKFAKEKSIDLTIVGPEHVLSAGLVDEFAKSGLRAFGPTKAAAQVESSKEFAKKLMDKYHIPTAAYATFLDLEPALAYVQKHGAPIVIKEDGLRAGKGVTVAMTLGEAEDALRTAFTEKNKVVIEECLVGEEFSLMAFVCGELVVPMEIAQDHKRVGDGDTGPNTGGMGAYSPVASIPQSAIDETMARVMEPMAKAMVAEGVPFTGFLYGGLMLTKDGVKTIEFNARFGDPEAEVLLPRLESDFVEALLQIMDGKRPTLTWSKQASLGVVLASTNYPESSTLGATIEGCETVDGLVFHMGTKEENGALRTNGGRVLIVVSMADSLQGAYDKAYTEVQKIHSEKLFYRKDIGKKSL